MAHKGKCKTCRHTNYSKVVEKNTVQPRPKDVCMDCMKAGHHKGCEKKQMTCPNGKRYDIKY